MVTSHPMRTGFLLASFLAFTHCSATGGTLLPRENKEKQLQNLIMKCTKERRSFSLKQGMSVAATILMVYALINPHRVYCPAAVAFGAPGWFNHINWFPRTMRPKKFMLDLVVPIGAALTSYFLYDIIASELDYKKRLIEVARELFSKTDQEVAAEYGDSTVNVIKEYRKKLPADGDLAALNMIIKILSSAQPAPRYERLTHWS